MPKKPATNECQWFHGCHNPSIGALEHPTIGWVECCEQHMVWVLDDPSPTKMMPPMVARSMGRLGR